MPKIAYIPKRFSKSSIETIARADMIIEEYSAKGFNLTLRQLYYQFVARGLIPNRQSEYKKLGSIINDARLAGFIDWEAIVDRTRNLQTLSHWNGPGDIVRACARQYHVDMWEGQAYRPEVWIEKDALVGVIEGVCKELDVPYFSCRGYTSQSEMWSAAQRLIEYHDNGQESRIIHLGDHDPSGIDMSRDIEVRLRLFMGPEGYEPTVERIALNMDQVNDHNPPPNPAKITDARAAGYIREYGGESWELDALDPSILEGLIRFTVKELIDPDPWEDKRIEKHEARERLQEIADGLENEESEEEL